MLSERVQKPVVLINDADASAVAEAWIGAGKDKAMVMISMYIPYLKIYIYIYIHKVGYSSSQKLHTRLLCIVLSIVY